jgi:hypothetical protein
MNEAMEILSDFTFNCEEINLEETEVVKVGDISLYEEEWVCVNHIVKEMYNLYVSYASRTIEMI